METREITRSDDRELAAIIRKAFEDHSLAIPGTVYYDPGLDNLSSFYLEAPEKRKYFVLLEDGKVLGGIGFAEFEALEDYAEIQKFYLSDEAKGKGYGRMLLALAEEEARKLGYRTAYIETHSNFSVAIQMYGRHGYHLIERPSSVSHGAMDSFLIKNLQD